MSPERIAATGTSDISPLSLSLVAVSAFNGGIAVGSSVGGRSLDSLGETGPATVGVAMVALGLVPLAALAMRRVSRAKPATEQHRLDPCAAHAAHA